MNWLLKLSNKQYNSSCNGCVNRFTCECDCCSNIRSKSKETHYSDKVEFNWQYNWSQDKDTWL